MLSPYVHDGFYLVTYSQVYRYELESDSVQPDEGGYCYYGVISVSVPQAAVWRDCFIIGDGVIRKSRHKAFSRQKSRPHPK